MIFLFVLAMTAMAEEVDDRTEKVYKSFCVNCHGESVEKIPLNPDSTLEDKTKAINYGVSSMPPYNWMLQEGEAEKLVKYMESIK